MSVYEMRKKQQEHEVARNMCRTEVVDGRDRTNSAKMEQYLNESDDEEVEELSFILGAASEPRWPCTCATTNAIKVSSFHQLAAIVVEDGGAAHTINVCKHGYNLMRMKRGERKVSASRWREIIEQKNFRGKLWVASGMEQFMRRMWEHFTIKHAWADQSW